MPKIESLLSARLFLQPQLVGDRLYFISNLSGHMSLFSMEQEGGVPQPLLPPDVALQNPRLMAGYSYYAFPQLDRVLFMLDQHGDENYQPNFIPLGGDEPTPLFQDTLANHRVHLVHTDAERNIAYFGAESQKEQMLYAFKADLKSGALTELGRSMWGSWVDSTNEDHTQAILIDGYTAGDHTLYIRREGVKERELLYGKPLEERKEGEEVKPNGIGDCQFIEKDKAIFFVTYLFDETGGLGYLDLKDPTEVSPLDISGTVHKGQGMLEDLEHLHGNRYVLGYNIDGSSWYYEGVLDIGERTLELETVLCGHGDLSNGVLESLRYDKEGDRYALSFSSATSPTQLYTLTGEGREARRITRERVLGVPEEWLSVGEDASFESFDGLRVSGRLYLPAKDLGFKGPRPLVYYVHGGPQSQERPDFAWFSMPLIQILTMKGFAVFVPNVRGSTGYGMSYMKRVDRDWGGKDRLDHVHAMTKVLPKDRRLDVSRAGVVGRSYGGYMSLTLAARHPELWSAAVDMWGPYNLLTFMERIPETWKPYFAIAVGDPAKDRDFLKERSPQSYMGDIQSPLMVLQGKNDPRVVEQESRDIVEQLREKGKVVDYLMFEDEGHDVLKLKNRVACYNAITEFFEKHLRP